MRYGCSWSGGRFMASWWRRRGMTLGTRWIGSGRIWCSRVGTPIFGARCHLCCGNCSVECYTLLVMTTKLQARFDGKVLVPTTPVSLPTDQVLDVEVRGSDQSPVGDPQEILRVLRSLPPLPPEYFDDLERVIEEAKLPVRHEGIFDDEK